jgi:hypothetical protein
MAHPVLVDGIWIEKPDPKAQCPYFHQPLYATTTAALPPAAAAAAAWPPLSSQ